MELEVKNFTGNLLSTKREISYISYIVRQTCGTWHRLKYFYYKDSEAKELEEL